MKKSFKIFILLTSIFMILGILLTDSNGISQNIYAQEAEYEPKNIYSEDYPDGYEVLINSAVFNRAMNELSKKYDFEIKPDSLELIDKKYSTADSYKGRYFGTDFIEGITFNISSQKADVKYPPHTYNLLTVSIDYNMNHIPEKYDFKEDITFLTKLFTQGTDLSHYIDAVNQNDWTINYDTINSYAENPREFSINMLPIDTEDNTQYIAISVGLDKVYGKSLDSNLLVSEKKVNMTSIIHKDNQKDQSIPEDNNSDFFHPNSYQFLDYTDIMRDRDGLQGTKHIFYAEVLKYMEEDDFATALLMKDGNQNQLYNASFFTLPDSRLIEGDIVEVYGILLGIESYTTVSGDAQQVPYITIDKILIEGVDY